MASLNPAYVLTDTGDKLCIDTDAGLSAVAHYMASKGLLSLPVWHWSEYQCQYISRWRLHRLEGFSRHVFFG